MKRNIALSLILLTGLAVFGCAGANLPPSGPQPPIITSAYAVDQGVYGQPIMVCLAAEDPDGNMERIAVQVNQVGYGIYPTSFIFLKPKYQKQFVGYLQWNTFSSEADNIPEWTRMTMTISVQDSSGKYSNSVALPYTFAMGAPSNPSLPASFNQGKMRRIGWIDVELINPQEGPGAGPGMLRR